ncbi:phosphoenolpyruvate--protein phosphotransferase [Nocardia sp. NPDC004604]|uniref:phosphoenolpyruvate--protein phosphotransferase n=1 Tax=Nocardia sp. NPDC004604 TaxID=3157013 RepID=UPI00339DB7D6
MIGIVVVSHSFPLARAAVELATEMLHDQQVRIEIAAGLDATTLGTDAVAVAQAIAAADSGDGVLVLMDLGSAVLSAELALDLLAAPHRVRLCGAPIVEGLITASVCASGGAGLDEVASEAENALLGKRTQLRPSPTDSGEAGEPVGGGEPASEGGGGASDDLEAAVAVFTVENEHGLHARPAARLVTELRGCRAKVRLRNLTTGTGPVSAASLSRVAALGALAGHRLEVSATGLDAQAAVARVIGLAARRFDEIAEPEMSVSASGPTGPFPASPGIGIGPAWPLVSSELDIPQQPTGTPDDEWARFAQALATVRIEITAASRRAGSASGIFEAHLLLLEDEELLDTVRREIDAGTSAAAAWAGALDAAAAEVQQLSDDYQRTRAADLRAVRDQVLGSLLGDVHETVSPVGVVIAPDLTPAQVADLDPASVIGIILAQDSSTSHSVILARASGIPAVVGAGSWVLEVVAGTTVALDGGTGRLVVAPDGSTLAEFETLAAEQRARLRADAATANQPATTLDGVEVHVAANIASVAEAVAAKVSGADLAGLVRTEFLFLGRDHAPDIDEQEHAYLGIAGALEGRRIVLRTLDVGGDKPLPYVPQRAEANPFLGVRGIRLTLERPQLLRDQLTAIGRVAADHPVSVLLPMVTDLTELQAVRKLLADTVPQAANLEVGIMVEVPATAAKTAAFADHVDFFSIGTNDLTQYALAAERGNDAVAALADPLDPGVLRLIDMVCRGAGNARVAVCGEVAADPAAVPILLGLGVTELSVAPRSIPTIKAAIRQLDLSVCIRLATHALQCGTAAEVRRALSNADAHVG